MVSTIGAITPASTSAQIAALEQQLAQYQRQLIKDERSGGTAAQAMALQLDAAQIALIESQITEVGDAQAGPGTLGGSNPSPVSVTARPSPRGSLINVTA